MTEPPKEPLRMITSETLTSGPYISVPFVAFQTMCDEVRMIHHEAALLLEYLEGVIKEASVS